MGAMRRGSPEATPPALGPRSPTHWRLFNSAVCKRHPAIPALWIAVYFVGCVRLSSARTEPKASRADGDRPLPMDTHAPHVQDMCRALLLLQVLFTTPPPKDEADVPAPSPSPRDPPAPHEEAAMLAWHLGASNFLCPEFQARSLALLRRLAAAEQCPLPAVLPFARMHEFQWPGLRRVFHAWATADAPVDAVRAQVRELRRRQALRLPPPRALAVRRHAHSPRTRMQPMYTHAHLPHTRPAPSAARPDAFLFGRCRLREPETASLFPGRPVARHARLIAVEGRS